MPPLRHSAATLSRLMDLQESNPTDAGWLGRAGSRLRIYWPTKMIGTMAIMTAFFVIYFWLLNHTRSPVTTVPPIFLDRLIPFEPWALPLYVSLWLYVPLAPALITDRRDLLSYGWATVALSAVGFGIFILWPTNIPKPDIDWSQHPSVFYLKTVDASGNAFPSLHVGLRRFHGDMVCAHPARDGRRAGCTHAQLAVVPGHHLLHARHPPACRAGRRRGRRSRSAIRHCAHAHPWSLARA